MTSRIKKTADVTKFIRRYGILSQAFATNTRTFANIRGSIFTHSRHIRGGRRLHSHIAHIRTHSRTFAGHSRTFAHIRGSAHIRTHSRTFALGPRRFAGDTRTFANRFTEIRAHSQLDTQIRGEIRTHSQRIHGHLHAYTCFTCAYLRMNLVTSAVIHTTFSLCVLWTLKPCLPMLPNGLLIYGRQGSAQRRLAT